MSLNSPPMFAGRDHWRHPLPVHLHGDPLPALPVALSLLGGLLTLLGDPAAHHVQGQPPGAILSTATLTLEGREAALNFFLPLCKRKEER